MESPLITITADIAANASITGVIDCSSGRPAQILMPDQWDTADMTVQVSANGKDFVDLYDNANAEYSIKVAASHGIRLPLADFVGIRFMKLRSGTSGSPVTQTAKRTLTIILVP